MRLLPRSLSLSPFALVATLLALPLDPVRSAEWPNFRGPNYDGISQDRNLLKSGKTSAIWKGEVGLGYSAPVVFEGKLVISGHDGKGTDTIYCLDPTSGAERWTHSYPQPLGDLYFQGGTTGSSAIHQGRVFHLSREGLVFCLDAARGDVIWMKDLQADYDYTKPTWGFSGAPYCNGDRVYFNVGESGVCLGTESGDIIWKSDDEDAGYSTPFPLERNGRRCLIFSNKRFYVCVDEGTGEKIWEYKWMTRYGVNAADPIVSGNFILLSSGYGKGAVLLNWTGQGEPERVWQNRELKTQMNAGVLLDGYVYGIDGNSVQGDTGLTCIEFATGKSAWKEKSIGHGAVIAVGNQLVVCHESGLLEVAPATASGYSPTLSQQVIPAKVWTAPVYVNGTLFCRNAGGQLVALNMSKK